MKTVERLGIIETKLKHLEKENWAIIAIVAAQFGIKILPLAWGALIKWVS